MKLITLIATASLAAPLWAQDAADKNAAPAPAPAEAAAPALTPEEKAIADQANAYMAAYNKGDAKTMAATFADDAQWVDDEGNVHSGKKVITEMLEAAHKGSPGRTLDISVNSVRPLTPDVLVETGTNTVTEKDGSNSVSSYTAVHVKKDGKWLVTQYTETGSPFAGNSTLHLEDLSWLIGTWVDQSEGIKVSTTVNWTPSRSFLTRAFTVTRGDGAADEGTEIIAWDPSSGKIRSWVFESDGGFSECTWTQDGPRWLIQTRTVLPDGGQATAQHTLTKLGNDKFTWSSANRELDGELMPNIEPVTIVREK